MNNRNYVVTFDENGQPYIEHTIFTSAGKAVGNASKWAKSHKDQAVKYVGKVVSNGRTRYFYTKEELDAYYNKGKNAIGGAAKKAGGAIKGAASKVGGTVKGAASRFGSSKVGGAVKGAAARAGSAVGGAARKAGSAVAGAAGRVGDKLGFDERAAYKQAQDDYENANAFNATKRLLNLNDTRRAYAGTVAGKVEGAAQRAGSAVGGAAKKAGSAISGAAKKAGSAVSGAAKRAGEAIDDAADRVASSKAAQTVAGAAKKAGSAVSGAAQKAGSAVKEAAGNVRDAAREAADRFGIDEYKELLDAEQSIGIFGKSRAKAALEEYRKTPLGKIDNALSSAGSWTKKAAGTVASHAKDTLADIDEWAKETGEGIRNTANAVGGAAKKAGSAISGAAKKAGSAISGAASAVAGAAKSATTPKSVKEAQAAYDAALRDYENVTNSGVYDEGASYWALKQAEKALEAAKSSKKKK